MSEESKALSRCNNTLTFSIILVFWQRAVIQWRPGKPCIWEQHDMSVGRTSWCLVTGCTRLAPNLTQLCVITAAVQSTQSCGYCFQQCVLMETPLINTLLLSWNAIFCSLILKWNKWTSYVREKCGIIACGSEWMRCRHSRCHCYPFPWRHLQQVSDSQFLIQCLSKQIVATSTGVT